MFYVNFASCFDIQMYILYSTLHVLLFCSLAVNEFMHTGSKLVWFVCLWSIKVKSAVYSSKDQNTIKIEHIESRWQSRSLEDVAVKPKTSSVVLLKNRQVKQTST